MQATNAFFPVLPIIKKNMEARLSLTQAHP